MVLAVLAPKRTRKTPFQNTSRAGQSTPSLAHQAHTHPFQHKHLRSTNAQHSEPQAKRNTEWVSATSTPAPSFSQPQLGPNTHSSPTRFSGPHVVSRSFLMSSKSRWRLATTCWWLSSAVWAAASPDTGRPPLSTAVGRLDAISDAITGLCRGKRNAKVCAAGVSTRKI